MIEMKLLIIEVEEAIINDNQNDVVMRETEYSVNMSLMIDQLYNLIINSLVNQTVRTPILYAREIRLRIPPYYWHDHWLCPGRPQMTLHAFDS